MRFGRTRPQPWTRFTATALGRYRWGDMRSSGVVLALLVLGVLPAAAYATTWEAPLALPSAAVAHTGTVVADGRGDAIVVTATAGY